MRWRWDFWRGWGPRPEEAQDSGRWGEDFAARFLRKNRRFKILALRVRLDRRNELDLVARDGDTLVFVEVKTRASEDFGRPIDSVDRAKRAALSRAAVRYLARLRRKPAYFRFDVVEVIGEPGDSAPAVRHIENAFPLSRPYRVPW
jgi:putative endonuclease